MVEAFVPRRKFRTPTEKVELYSTKLEKYGYDPLPTWKEPMGQPNKEYPFYLSVSRPPTHFHSTTQNVLWLWEVMSENYLLINTSKAKEMGIKDGDEVYAESEFGKVKIRAKLSEGIREDTVFMLHGFGHISKDLKLTYGRGANDNALVRNMKVDEMLELRDPVAPACLLDVPVKVYKAGGGR